MLGIDDAAYISILLVTELELPPKYTVVPVELSHFVKPTSVSVTKLLHFL